MSRKKIKTLDGREINLISQDGDEEGPNPDQPVQYEGWADAEISPEQQAKDSEKEPESD